MKTALQILIDTREIIKLPENWIQKRFCVNTYLTTVNPVDQNAYKFSLLAAIHKACNRDYINEYKTIDEIKKSIACLSNYENFCYNGVISLTLFNANNDHSTILNLLDMTINRVQNIISCAELS